MATSREEEEEEEEEETGVPDYFSFSSPESEKFRNVLASSDPIWSTQEDKITGLLFLLQQSRKNIFLVESKPILPSFFSEK